MHPREVDVVHSGEVVTWAIGGRDVACQTTVGMRETALHIAITGVEAVEVLS
jgi:hypothetical protein